MLLLNNSTAVAVEQTTYFTSDITSSISRVVRVHVIALFFHSPTVYNCILSRSLPIYKSSIQIRQRNHDRSPFRPPPVITLNREMKSEASVWAD